MWYCSVSCGEVHLGNKINLRSNPELVFCYASGTTLYPNLELTYMKSKCSCGIYFLTRQVKLGNLQVKVGFDMKKI